MPPASPRFRWLEAGDPEGLDQLLYPPVLTPVPGPVAHVDWLRPLTPYGAPAIASASADIKRVDERRQHLPQQIR
jgi:hypothetical protein